MDIRSNILAAIMPRWRWVLLISELFLFALILVLPQVDLPDFTFRDGHAPAVVRLQLASPPVTSGSTGGLSIRPDQQPGTMTAALDGSTSPLDSSRRHSLFSVLLC